MGRLWGCTKQAPAHRRKSVFSRPLGAVLDVLWRCFGLNPGWQKCLSLPLLRTNPNQVPPYYLRQHSTLRLTHHTYLPHPLHSNPSQASPPPSPAVYARFTIGNIYAHPPRFSIPVPSTPNPALTDSSSSSPPPTPPSSPDCSRQSLLPRSLPHDTHILVATPIQDPLKLQISAIAFDSKSDGPERRLARSKYDASGGIFSGISFVCTSSSRQL